MSVAANVWAELAGSPVLAITVTLVAYQLGCWANRRCGGSPLVNPVLIAILLVAGFLALSGTDYAHYFRGAQLIHLLLGPATVALAVPLYENFERIKASALAVILAVLAGGATAVATTVLLAWALGATPQLILTLAPKSVTAPIAIAIAEEIGGLPSLTAVLVISTAIIGAMTSVGILDRLGITCWRARGLATGVAAHGIGTARILSLDATGGAFAGLGMGLCGMASAVLLPLGFHLMW